MGTPSQPFPAVPFGTPKGPFLPRGHIGNQFLEALVFSRVQRALASQIIPRVALRNLFPQGLGPGGAGTIRSSRRVDLFPRPLRAGVPPERILYSGVGKTASELRQALDAGILLFNVESQQELERLAALAQDMGREAPCAFRVNPDVDPRTHAYISTGLAKNKFGIPRDEALEAYRRAASLQGIRIRGISCHIGSQLTETAPFIEALRKMLDCIDELRSAGLNVEYLDLGGGLGITYEQETPPHPQEYAAALIRELGDRNLTLLLEPGRVIAGNAGILVTEVQYTKTNSGSGKKRRFVIVDAAMNDLCRPSLYGAYHHIQPVAPRLVSSRQWTWWVPSVRRAISWRANGPCRL